MTRNLLHIALAVLGLLCLAGHAHASGSSPHERLYVFGDSLSDIGNFTAATGLPPSPPYAEDRLSNGPIWIDHLLDALGIDPLAPEYLNFAIAGATTGTHNTVNASLGGLASQVAAWAALAEAPDPAGAGLYIVFAGSNDYGHNPDPPAVVANIRDAITTLTLTGAADFLVPNLTDIGATPRALAQGPAVSAGLTALTNAHNDLLGPAMAQLAADLEVNIIVIDTNTLFADIVANPAAYGFVEVEEACVDIAAETVCPVSEWATTLFWDELHPNAAAHLLLADLAGQALGVTIIDTETSVDGWQLW